MMDAPSRDPSRPAPAPSGPSSPGPRGAARQGERRARGTRELPPRLQPAAFEEAWQRRWEASGVFQAPRGSTAGPHWTIVLPPPNVTGILTFGHSLGGTVQDLLCRRQRMKGVPTLWLPGVDHAGLATQMAVRKDLERRGVHTARLTREELLGHIQAWRVEKEQYIRHQLTAHGFSLDWSRYVYTMDPGYSEAVRTAFLRLYREKLVYRAERMVHWDPKALTALSDLEVIPTETHGKLWYIRYPAAPDRPGAAARPEGGIVVATTRPETMFGDVAVAVHPDDERHRPLVGGRVRLPLTDRDIPVVTDAAIDPTFGNGALKVTPSHDKVDHEIALRHPELPARRETLDERGHLTGEFVPSPFRGMDRGKAREHIVATLREGGLLVKEEPHVHNVGISERSDVPVEPRFSTQWFVDVKRMGARALEAVRSGEVRIYPTHWTKTYYNFMENLQDWCISRQVLWGHPIPVWYCDACRTQDAYEVPPSTCPRCGQGPLRADPDVLDTWFSSWLWPFATLGWPAATPDLAAYFPVSVLVTGSDIVFFWVARMIMGSLQFLDHAPFPQVYLTGILTDRQGRKLSKHLGNSPDPLELIQAWGADAFRFGLLFPLPVDEGGFWDHQRTLEGSRNFLTKLWNLCRLLLGNLPEGTPAPREAPRAGPAAVLWDRWLLARWAATLHAVDRALDGYEMTAAMTALHGFVWHEAADWWAEASKERLTGLAGEEARQAAARVGLFVLERTLRALHPAVPHVTEELWHALPHEGELLARAPWPAPSEAPADPEAEELVAALQRVVRGLRVVVSEAKWSGEPLPRAWVRPQEGPVARVLTTPGVTSDIVRLARVASLERLDDSAPAPEGARSLVVPGAELFLLPPKGSVAAPEEALALRRERDLVAGLLLKAEARLADPTFRARAPAEVVAQAEAKRQELADRLVLLDRHLAPRPASTSPAGAGSP